jgi:integrase
VQHSLTQALAQQKATSEILREDNARQGFVTFEEFTALVTHIPTPVDDVTHFAFRSGWRRGEVLTLTWDDVDQDNGVIRLRPELSKNRKGRTLPITPAAGEILSRRWHARFVMTPDGPRVCALVFHRDGQPVRDFEAAWRKAAKAIGWPELLFHDLRRSAVRNFEQAGVPRSVAMELTGHLTESVYRRYAHRQSGRQAGGSGAPRSQSDCGPAQFEGFPAH